MRSSFPGLDEIGHVRCERKPAWLRSWVGSLCLALMVGVVLEGSWAWGSSSAGGGGRTKPDGGGGVLAGAEESLGVSREVWISLRTDGLAGDGTLGNPYNGTGDRLDALLRGWSVERQQSNMVIHLLPGIFETRGVLNWHPLGGWKIRGAGIDVTTLKLVNVSNNVYAVIHTATLHAEYVEVSDLTVDCNYSATNPSYAHAVVLTGSHNVIRRVKAIHAFGLEPIENFTLAVGMGLGPRSEGNVIEGCEVSQFAGYYCSAIFMGGGQEPFNSRFIKGTIRNNIVLDLHHPLGHSVGIAYGGGGWDDFVVEGNISDRCDIAFNVDTGRSRDVTFRGNRFLRCYVRGISLTGRELDTVVVENNFIEMDARSPDWAIACYDSGGLIRLRNIFIRNNTIRSADGFFSPAGGIGVISEWGHTFHITGNRVDGMLQNLFTGEGFRLFDNTDFEGNPIFAPQDPGTPVQLPRGMGGTLVTDQGAAHVLVETQEDPVINGQRLVAAYERASRMRPHQQPLSATNRAVIFVFPGRYVLADGALNLTAPWVDVVGLGPREAVRLESDGNTVTQVAGDVRLENLTMHCSSPAVAGRHAQDKAAYFPESNLSGTIIRNCAFSASRNGWSMRLGTWYSGTYERCVAGVWSWGGLGGFTGRAEDCRAGDYSFGSGGVFTGAATNCHAGVGSFGGGQPPVQGGFHGAARNCHAGHDSFGGSGLMIGCDVAGSVSLAVPTTGRLTDCRIGPAPGLLPAIVVGAGAALYNCTVLANPAGAGFTIDALAPVTVRVAHCRLNRGMRNVVNAISDPFNVVDPNLD